MFWKKKQDSQGFTLIEIIVAISIGAILMTVAIAPYNLYTDKARVRLSAERIEQLISKARLFASTGYSVGDKNQDLIISIEVGGSSINLERTDALGKWAPIPSAGNASRVRLEGVSLESSVKISGLWSIANTAGATPIISTNTTDRVLLVFRAPLGTLEYWSESGVNIPTILTTPPNMGIVGIKGVMTGLRSKAFSLP